MDGPNGANKASLLLRSLAHGFDGSPIPLLDVAAAAHADQVALCEYGPQFFVSGDPGVLRVDGLATAGNWASLWWSIASVYHLS